jgi:ribosomal protein S9
MLVNGAGIFSFRFLFGLFLSTKKILINSVVSDKGNSHIRTMMRGSSKSAIVGLAFPSRPASSRACAAFHLSANSPLTTSRPLLRSAPISALAPPSTSSPLLPLSVLPSSQRTRHYAVKTKNFERKEARYDFSDITDRAFPRLPPKPIDFRNYVPAEEADEEDDWKPEEDYPEPSFAADQSSNQHFYPVITPQPVPVKIDRRTGAFLGTGRRKAAIARVALLSGQGKIIINGRQMHDYFPCFFERGALLAPFVAIERPNAFDVNVTVSGGGTKGTTPSSASILLKRKREAKGHSSFSLSLSTSRPSRGHPAGHRSGSAELQHCLPSCFEEGYGSLVALRAPTGTQPCAHSLARWRSYWACPLFCVHITAGCLERDARVVESKKAGRVKARKRPQWSKR